jgi:hypothetical protein
VELAGCDFTKYFNQTMQNFLNSLSIPNLIINQLCRAIWWNIFEGTKMQTRKGNEAL